MVCHEWKEVIVLFNVVQEMVVGLFPSPQCLLKKQWAARSVRPTKHKNSSFRITSPMPVRSALVDVVIWIRWSQDLKCSEQYKIAKRSNNYRNFLLLFIKSRRDDIFFCHPFGIFAYLKCFSIIISAPRDYYLWGKIFRTSVFSKTSQVFLLTDMMTLIKLRLH